MNNQKKVNVILLATFTWGMSTIINTVYLFYLPNKFGMSEMITSLIISLNFIAVLIGTLIIPKLLRRYELRKVITVSALTSSFICLLAGVFYNKLIIIFLTAIIYFFSSIIGLLTRKIISEIDDKQIKTKAYSHLFTIVSLSSIIVSIIGPYVFKININNMQYIYFFISFFQFLSFFFLRYAIQSGNENKNVDTSQSLCFEDINDNTESVESSQIMIFKVNEFINIKMLLGICGLFFGIFQIAFLIPKFLEINYSITIYSTFLIIHTLICIISGPILLKILNQKTPYYKLSLAGLLLIISFILFPIHSHIILFITTILFSISQVLLFTNLDIYLLEFYKGKDYDRTMVITRFTTQIMEILAAPIAAIFLITSKASYGFFFVSLVVCLGVILLRNFQGKNDNLQ